MTNLKKQTFSVLAAGAMLLNVATPALAGTSIEITGNGAGSDNWTTVNQNNTNTVTQNNTANVTNTVNADAKTGGNDANFNTGGNTVIGTGDAKVTTNIQNALNTNSADVDCCDAGDTHVDISKNGAYSDNGVTLDKNAKTTVSQKNTANVTNTVNADAKTGNNEANKNTGGDVIIGTGDAKVTTNITTAANVNSAKVGNNGAGSQNPSASFVISGNGAGSDNYITALLGKTTTVAQNNTANVTNDVDADANTGKNDTNFNTGGDVIIGTGDATVNANVDNAVNFNAADVDCGCTWDVYAKIAGNGADTDKWWWDEADNLIDLNLDSAQALAQGNTANLTNDLTDLDAKTGYNDAELNTGDVDTDPAIYTGNATVNSDVENTGNSNVAGDFSPFDLPEMPNMNVSFNMASFWAMWGGMFN